MRSRTEPPHAPREAVRPLTDSEFANISRLAYEKFGLELKPERCVLLGPRDELVEHRTRGGQLLRCTHPTLRCGRQEA